LKTDDKYDVVIVGGGPAGSMAAKSAADKGAKTLLLERSHNTGPPVRCGEAVLLQSINRLIQIEDRWIAFSCKRGMLHFPDESVVEVNVEENQTMLILERAIFDRYLAETAAIAGADIITRANVDDLIISDNQVRGVCYSRMGKRYKAHAGVVIGADGVESRVGRWAGIDTRIAPENLGSAYQKTVTGIKNKHNSAHLYIGNNIANGGCIWVFPKGDQTANVGIAVVAGRSDPGAAYYKLKAFIKYHFGQPAIIAETAGGVPGSKPLKNMLHNGLLLCGDAAHLCNPLTGGGIFTAMLSGHHAGTVATEAIAKGDTSTNRLREYVVRIEKEIIHPHNHTYILAKAFRKMSDKTLNRAARAILSIPEGQRTLRNILLKGFITQPRLIIDVIKAFT